ncbi:hypothetical protein [Pseudomonas delhiensis]|uniref:Uncharacterized protein n=1 Tax=Pseudomonas delhiensis TaxID=366289 RepID=A0A239MP11_9PSED|nr:hypothetical protein [Pseudomonas delhiensis]SDH99722.1 hypothetical protein SAMN05216189_1001207 [Pseudomonas delhiensis]SNT44451.1 hypothetical protein SAMN06295949_12865 [Pseudomonas delhiensis]
MLKRTLLSAAIVSAMFAGAANAGVVSIVVGQSSNGTILENSPGADNQYAPGQANYKEGVSIETGANYVSRAANITIAQEVFGNLSETTQFDLPDLKYAIDLAKADKVDVGHTVKLTLDRTVAQFANTITPNQIQIGTLPAGEGFAITSGTGVNTLSLTLDSAGAAEIAKAVAESSIIHFNFRTNNTSNEQPARVDRLRAALQGDVTFLSQSNVDMLDDPLNERRFNVTVSAQLDTTTGPNGGDAKNNDSAPPLMVFTSLPAVYWDVLNVNTWGQYQVLHSLDLANQDKSFDTSVSAQPELTDPTNYGVNYARLGSVRLGVNQDVLNEDGRNVFGFNGSDKLSSYVSGNFSGIDSVGLTSGTCQAFADGSAAAAHSWSAADILANTGANGVARLPLSLVNGDVNQTYNICVKSNGVDPMVAQQSFAVGPLSIDFGNVRYVDRVINGGEIDHFWKSSCVASLFNLPAANNADAFFIRLTNTSDSGRSGKVRGVLFDQNGKRYPEVGSAYIVDQSGKEVLQAHETGVYSVEQVASAFGVNGNDWNGVGGRARLVIEGEFPTCEALGLIRTPNGTLVNMTSTTQGNFNGDSGPSTTVNHRGGNNRN